MQTTTARLLAAALLMLAHPAWSQAPGSPYAVDQPAREPVLITPSDTLATTVSALTLELREHSESERGSAAAAQPTMQGFLYQVLMTAVTALVTALIWRAVF